MEKKLGELKGFYNSNSRQQKHVEPLQDYVTKNKVTKVPLLTTTTLHFPHNGGNYTVHTE